MKTVAMLRRFYPGCDPSRMTYREVSGLMNRLSEILEMEDGGGDHRSIVERDMKRIAHQDNDDE